MAELDAHLSPDERARAARFHRDEDRERFAATRGLLRELLARELDVPAADVTLIAEGGGRPALHPDHARPELRFNASHSGRLAAFALAHGRQVGVDVEERRPLSDLESVARRALSPSELQAWRRLAPEYQPDAFFAAWTRKEAYAKARGQGLPIGLQPIEPRPAGMPGRFEVPDPEGAAAAWTVATLALGDGYAGAVAAEGEGWALRVEQVAGQTRG